MYKKQKRQNKSEVFQAFMNHCATIIQSNFRGYQQRKYYRKFMPLYRRFKQLLCAGFAGWKTRKIFKLTIVKNKMIEIKSLKSQQKNLQMRIAKRDLTDQISRLLKNGLWLYYFSKQKKIPLTQKAIGNKNQTVVMKKIDLKQAFNIIPKVNHKKIIQKDQNQRVDSKKIIKKEEPQEIPQLISLQTKQSQEKEKKSKKFENPPKAINTKTQKPKQLNLSIETEIEPQNIQVNSISCSTPNYSTNQLKQFSFHTRPRDPLPPNTQNQQLNKGYFQQPFKQIHFYTHSQRKGLNMTLSRKPLDEKAPDSTSINLEVLQDFTKKKNLQQQNSRSKNASLDLKEILDFSTKEDHKNVNKVLEQKLEPLQSGRSLALQMKKEAFEKRKKQFEKKSKQFKTVALK